MRKYLLHILATIYVKSSVVSDMSMISSLVCQYSLYVDEVYKYKKLKACKSCLDKGIHPKQQGSLTRQEFAFQSQSPNPGFPSTDLTSALHSFEEASFLQS